MFFILISISSCVFFLHLMLSFDFKMHFIFLNEYLIEIIISFRQIQFQIVLSFYDLILASITLHNYMNKGSNHHSMQQANEV